MSLLCPGLEHQGLLEGMPGEAGLARLPVEEARTRAMQVRHPFPHNSGFFDPHLTFVETLQAVEYYNAAVLGGGVRSTPEFKAPAPVAAASGDLILPAYKSLGAVYQKDSSPPQQGERERKKKMSNGGMTVPGSGTAKTRSSQHLAERSFSVTETNSRGQQGGTTGHNLSSSSSQPRTPHRTAGYGGAGQPNRGPHRFHNFTTLLSL